jgi:hypothetical protein
MNNKYDRACLFLIMTGTIAILSGGDLFTKIMGSAMFVIAGITWVRLGEEE